MSGLSYLELQTAVMFNTLGERFRAPVKQWLNDAVRDASRRLTLHKAACVGMTDADGLVDLQTVFWDIAEVYTMAAGTAAAEVSVAVVERGADQRLGPITSASASNLVGSINTPCGYEAISSGPALKLRVYPAPPAGSPIGVIGHAFPTAMANDADPTGLPPEIDEGLVAFCRARAFRREDDLQMAAMWDLEYISRLRGALPQRTVTSDGPQVTPGTWGYGDPWTGGG